MSTAAQIAANRTNAQLSLGRAPSKAKPPGRNALKFGAHAQSLVIPGEDPVAVQQQVYAVVRDQPIFDVRP